MKVHLRILITVFESLENEQCTQSGDSRKYFQKIVPHRVAATILVTKLLNLLDVLYVHDK